MATLKPTTPLLASNKGALKPASPLHPKIAPKTPISHPQRRWRFQSHTGTSKQRRRRFQSHTSTSEQRRWRFQTTAHLADRAQTRYPWAAAGPGRATSGRPTLQTSSNQRDSHRLARTPVTNVVNLSPKTTIFSEKALGLTTFVTTGQKSTRKTPPIDDVRNNTHPSTPKTQHARPPMTPTGSSGPDCGARGRWRVLAGPRADAPSRRLAARTARGRAAAHGHTKQPGPTRRPEHQRDHKQHHQ